MGVGVLGRFVVYISPNILFPRTSGPRNPEKCICKNVSIWNINCALAIAFIFDPQTDFLVKVSKISKGRWCLEGSLEPPTFGFMPNALTTWAIRARHLLSHVLDYWLWWYRYFVVKLTFEMLTVRGQYHSFSTVNAWRTPTKTANIITTK